jgi:hypothetical protein
MVEDDIGVVCEWYNLSPAPTETAASLTIHKSVCPADVAPEDRFERCHANGLAGVDFVLHGPVVRNEITRGHLGAIRWNDLPAGAYTVAEAIPTGDFIDYEVSCTRLDSDEPVPFEKRGNGRAAIQVAVEDDALVVCDWYNLAPTENKISASPANAQISLAVDPIEGPDGQVVKFKGSGYTPGGDVVVLMTGDGLIVAETQADQTGAISGSFKAPERDRLTGESSNEIPVFAIDQETGLESNRVTFRYLAP